MFFGHKKGQCKSIRMRLGEMVNHRLSLEAGWVADHVAGCERCQKRLAGYSRLQTAMMMIKSESFSRDLFKRANTQAIGRLSHAVRESEKAETLRQVEVRPRWYHWVYVKSQAVGQAAACLAVLFLVKVGIFSSVQRSQEKGEVLVKNIYKQQLGDGEQALIDELFT